MLKAPVQSTCVYQLIHAHSPVHFTARPTRQTSNHTALRYVKNPPDMALVQSQLPVYMECKHQQYPQ